MIHIIYIGEGLYSDDFHFIRFQSSSICLRLSQIRITLTWDEPRRARSLVNFPLRQFSVLYCLYLCTWKYAYIIVLAIVWMKLGSEHENNTVLNMIHQRMLNFHLGPQAQRTSYKSTVLHLRANMSRNISMSGLTLFLGKCLSTKLIRSFQHMVLGIKTNSLLCGYNNVLKRQNPNAGLPEH